MFSKFRKKKEEKVTSDYETSLSMQTREHTTTTTTVKTVVKNETQRVRTFSVPNATFAIPRVESLSLKPNFETKFATYSGATGAIPKSAFNNEPLTTTSNRSRPHASSLFPPRYELRKPSSSGDVNKSNPQLSVNRSLKNLSNNNFISTDAKPINPNYVSPYRNRFTYNVPIANPSNINQNPTTYTTSLGSANYNVPVLNTSITTKKLEITVKRSSQFCDEKSHVPTYKTRSKNRGVALIINNIDFKNDTTKQRKGAEIDQTNIEGVFREMGFEIKSYQNLNKTSMENTVRKFKDRPSLRKCDICVVVVMSHGTSKMESTQIECIDGLLLPTSSIIEQFDNKNCPYMQSKPKIFIFQCCRGNNTDNTIRIDAVPFKTGRKTEDMLIAYATVPGYVSYRDEITGTWYIQAICEVFMEHAHDTDVEGLLKIVDSKLAALKNIAKQTSSFENRGFKTCYFHPKLYE